MVICYFGDSLTLGFGDDAGLGWPGRITNALTKEDKTVTSYNLGVRKDTSTQLQYRWKSEVTPRALPDTPLKLVFSFGVADIASGVTGPESLAAGVAILTQAKAMGDVMVVGPTPINDREKREEITILSRMIESMCKQMDIPFVPTIDSMYRSFVYGQALNDGDGVHPTASGYADLAEHILKSNTARKFFGLE